MKKLVSICLLAIMLFSLLSSCGVKNTNSSTGTETSTNTLTNSNTETNTNTDTNSTVEPNNTNTSSSASINTETSSDTEENAHMCIYIDDIPTKLEFITLSQLHTYKYDYYEASKYAYKEYNENATGFSVSIYFDSVNLKNFSSNIEAFVINKGDGKLSKIDIVGSVAISKLEQNRMSFNVHLKETLPEDEVVLFVLDTKLNGVSLGFTMEYTPISYKEYLVGRFEYIKDANELEVTTYFSHSKPHITFAWRSDEPIEIPNVGVLEFVTFNVYFLDNDLIYDFEAIKIGDTLDDVLKIDKDAIVNDETADFPKESYHYFENKIYIFKYKDDTIFGIEKYILD